MADFQAVPYTMSDSLHVHNNEYNGFYRGTVLDNEDPDGRGRCKVYVYGVYDEKFIEENGKRLPWAEPSQPLFCGGFDKNGTFQCPDLSATVWLFFESGDITRPVIFGQTTDVKSLSADKTYQQCKTLFDTSSVTMYWDGMYIEMYKPTHTVTVSSENITAFASNDLSGHAERDVYIDAFHDINVYAKNDINVRADNNINISAGVNINTEAGECIVEQAGTSTSRTAPDNLVDGKEHITGNTTIDSTTTINATTVINSSETVAGDANIGGKSFLGHMHIGNMGAPTSPPI